MERLPYIDEHSIWIGATPEQVWRVLAPVLLAHLGGMAPARLTRAFDVIPAQPRGDWSTPPQLGDALRAFEVVQADPSRRLVLWGSHRFARYALVFELGAVDDSLGGDCCILRAQTWAEFPGPAGRLYRAIVIGTRGHRLVVRRLLGDVARRA
jgi:hypothetical protein